MEHRYVAHCYQSGRTHHSTIPDQRYRSSKLIELLAKASVYIEKYMDAYCEIWDEKEKHCISQMKRAAILD